MSSSKLTPKFQALILEEIKPLPEFFDEQYSDVIESTLREWGSEEDEENFKDLQNILGSLSKQDQESLKSQFAVTFKKLI